MGTVYGYAGKLLRVDLDSKTIAEDEVDEATAREYVGGTGLGVKYLYDEVPAGVDWSDAANRLIIASGPLGGTSVGGSGTISVVTKGPMTDGAVATQANGFFGAFLRFSGYDGIILQGRADKWVYLYIHDHKAELRDASHLVGKDTFETSAALKAELGNGGRQISVASIGPAGENLVRFAGVFVDRGHAAAHGGAGAVMGSKRLKAIAVARGKSPVRLKSKEQLAVVSRKFLDSVLNDPVARGANYTWGTLNVIHDRTLARDGNVPVKNYTTTVFDIGLEELEKWSGPYIRSRYEARPDPCWACRFHHCHTLTLTEGAYKGAVVEEPEYECLAACGPLIGNTDISSTIFLANEVDRLGMDVNEAGWTLALAMECYEKGLLDLDRTDGIPLAWGNHRAAGEVLRRIATRQGFGNILAEGAMRAARAIGGDAPGFAIHTMKGSTPKTHDHRNRWPHLLDSCVSQSGIGEGYSVAVAGDLGLPFKPHKGANSSAEDTMLWNGQCKGAEQIEDCLGVCEFNTRTNIGLLAEALSAATGWDVSPRQALETGRRIVTLARVFNIRHGHAAGMDTPSPRYGSTPVDGPTKGKSIMARWTEMRASYYEQMGWDRETGKPLPETLRRYGLERAIPEMWGQEASSPAP